MLEALEQILAHSLIHPEMSDAVTQEGEGSDPSPTGGNPVSRSPDDPENRAETQNEDPDAQPPPNLSCPLALWEALGKQFQDYKQSCPFLILSQQRLRLSGLLPLFLKVR
ncbi:hypothetical protein FKM82_020384 [Ascaphus truei]